jgi:oligopeptide transport system ATP-binding protein
MNEALLQIRGAKTHFPLKRGALWKRETRLVKAVDGVSLDIAAGETLGLVGESGCGKSTLARSIVKLAPLTEGSIFFEGKDIAAMNETALRSIRPRLQMIFQDPYASLNPRRTVFDTLAEPLLAHKICAKGDVPKVVGELMEQVGLARRYIRKYPHEFSGGQRQRIAIARALALKPKLIIADEPVSALDVSVQAQILNLLQDLSQELDLTLILIAHDLGVVRHMAQRIAVMYLGAIVELGPAEDVFDNPQHPYTKCLLSAIPTPDPENEHTRKRILLQGDPPSPLSPPEGCRFHPRCPWAIPACAAARPEFVVCGEGHTAACIRIGELGD